MAGAFWHNAGVSGVTLGFSPLPGDEFLFSGEEYDGGDDYRLFYMGDRLRSIQEDGLFFQALSHA